MFAHLHRETMRCVLNCGGASRHPSQRYGQKLGFDMYGAWTMKAVCNHAMRILTFLYPSCHKIPYENKQLVRASGDCGIKTELLPKAVELLFRIRRTMSLCETQPRTKEQQELHTTGNCADHVKTSKDLNPKR